MLDVDLDLRVASSFRGLLRLRGDLTCCGDLDLRVATSCRGLLRWRGDLLSCGSASLSISVAPTKPRPARAEQCMPARGSSAARWVASK
jgi:hypothetical protein